MPSSKPVVIVFMRNKLFFCTCILTLLSGCVSPFEHDGFKDYAGMLVVEGMIMEKGTTIQLSRTMAINPFAEVDFSDVNHIFICKINT